MENPVLFQSFNSREEASYLVELLEENKIPFDFISPPSSAASVIIRSELDNLYLLNLLPSDFAKVHQLIKQNETIDESNLPPDHYLLAFSDDELIDLLVHEDEWTESDQLFAKQILRQRGVVINESEIQNRNEERLRAEYAPKRGNVPWIIFGFIISLAGGIFGMLLGWSYYAMKTTDPKGRRQYRYNQLTRSVGFAMLLLGIISTIFWVIFFYINRYGIFSVMVDHFSLRK